MKDGVSAHWQTICDTPHRSGLRRRTIPHRCFKAYAQSLCAGQVLKCVQSLAVCTVAMLMLTLSPSPATGMRHYAGELPIGHDVMFYLHICSVCGDFYGGSVERDCIMDKTFITFRNCKAAILERRRK